MNSRLKLKREIILPIFALLIGICFIAINGKRSQGIEAAQRFLPPPPGIEHMSAGYNDVIADVLWLRLIQDADRCDQPVSIGQKCQTEKGWVFLMLDAITKLAPKFVAPYWHGATILSVLVGDKEGAWIIFERGMNNFPNDWQLPYRAAFHALENLGDIQKAADLLLQAGRNGAPKWVFALAARLYTKEGQAILAKSILESVLAHDPDGRWAPRLRERLSEIDQTLTNSPGSSY